MPTTFTSNVFSSTYKDDFLDSDNYHRILFNSGRALQARELTQMQTIIQEEIARFGRNIFKDGAAVNPGGPSINNDYEFVKLNTTSNTLPADPTTLVGTEFTGASSTVKVRVLEVVVASGSDPATLYVQYTNTSGGATGATPVRLTSGENIGNGSTTLTVQTTNTSTNPAVGVGCKIHNAAGDFFVRGHFVFAKPQGLILSKYSNNVTKVVGFKITEDIVKTSDDASLFDNQGATPNVTSPGADRYRIQLVLTTQDAVASDENFVFFCSVVDGNIVDQVSGTDDYNKINDLLAERTSEESGNYIAKRFTSSLSDSGTSSFINVSNGTAYVNGYRAAAETPTLLTIPKPQQTSIIQNDVVGVTYGSYFICSTLKGNLNVSAFASVNLSTHATDPSGSVIGTAKVRYVEEDGSNHRVYLFDIKMNSGQSLRDAKTIGTGSVDVGIIALEGAGSGKAVLKEASKTNLVYTMTHPRPKDITDVSFEVQRIKTGTISDGSGNLTIAGLSTGETYVNTSQIIVTRDDTGAVIASPSISGTGTNSLTLGGLGANGDIIVYAKVNKSQPSVRQKTLTETTMSGAVESDGTGVKWVDVGKTDLFDTISIKQTDSNGIDLSALFSVDNGQRSSHYANARLVLEKGATAPSGNVFTRFKHFTHGAGDFFSVNSYDGQVNYEDIPPFRVNTRKSINLRDVIDFRSSVDASGTFTGSGAALNEIPTNGDVFQGDIEYYLRRSDKIVITTQGEVKNILGEDGFSSQIPPTPENTLALFEVEHNAYGLHDSDVSVRPLEAKRFTMKDISKLEKRIDTLEEVTSLSLLEVDTNALLVLDNDGNPRSKSGFFVDNFANRAFTDVQNPEYRAAIDPSLGLLQPQQTTDNVTLRYDSDKSTNTILKGDTVYIKHTHTPAISQTKVSGTENVNPFAVITGTGSITLSPSSDEWQDTVFNPANIINEVAEEITDDVTFFASYPYNWSTNNWVPMNGWGSIYTNHFSGWNGEQMWNWNGTTSRPVERRPEQQFQGAFSNRIVVGTRTVREVIGDREVSLTFLPFIRSRKVFFKAQGLRPNTRYYPFFDSVDMTNFVKEETFERFSKSTSGGVEYGNKFRNKTSHPQSSSQLITDANGHISGSFFIPAQDGEDGIKFRSGTREFKLLDISQDNDASATSRASINYVAQGTLSTRQQTITSTRITEVRPVRRWTDFHRVCWKDPLAQSFRVTESTGIFVTKVDCFFKTKDASAPIEMQIRPMVNGAPSSTDIIANAIKFVNSGSVALPAGQTAAEVVAAPTTFEFDEPIFLNPDTEYAIVLIAESVDYEAYVAETYEYELGSTELRINRQPSMGSLFKSQNGTTWEPDQTKDLMFVVHKAVFDTVGGSAIFENTDVQSDLLRPNPLYSVASDATITMYLPNHGYAVNDVINISGLVDGTTYNGITGANINGNRTVTVVDGFGIQFEAGSAANASGRFGGSEVITNRQIEFDGMIPNFTTLIPDDTSIKYGAKFTTGNSLAGNETRYSTDATYINDLSIGEENYFNAPRIVASPVSEADTNKFDAGTRSVSFKIDLSTIRADVSPIVDAQRSSLTTMHNNIDNQVASGATVGQENVPINYVAETNSFGGSSLAKHMTSVQSLEEPAVGLKVIVAALRPSGADFDLYFRTAQDGENILDIDWTLQSREQTVAPDDRNFREYRYLIGGLTGTIKAFTQYQYKIVMRSNNSSRVPVFKDLRSIAMAT